MNPDARPPAQLAKRDGAAQAGRRHGAEAAQAGRRGAEQLLRAPGRHRGQNGRLSNGIKRNGRTTRGLLHHYI